MVWTNAFKMSIPASISQMTPTYQRRKLLTVLVTIIALLHITVTQAQPPVDHLIPPPPPLLAPLLPIPQALTHNRPHDYSKRFETHPIPLQRDVSSGIDNQTGLMTRIARWFGFSGNPQEQQLVAASFKHPAYTYPRPQEQFPQNEKANCNLCNKYPWIPMMPLSMQYPPVQQQYQAYQQAHWNQQQAQGSKHAPAFLPISQNPQQTSVKQRAVQFNFPQRYSSDISKLKSIIGYQPKGPAYAASSQPNLNLNALPPIYNAQPFQSSTSTFVPLNEQQLPTTQPAHFTENVGAHSELEPEHIIPTQIPPTVSSYENSNVEIIKSHQLTDFVSSIEYPATYVQSQAFDVGTQTQIPFNHKLESQEPTNTVSYHPDSVQPFSNNHIPASQLLTDPGSLDVPIKDESSTVLQTRTTYAPQKEAYTIQNHNEDPSTTNTYSIDISLSGDNFPSASSHNNQNSVHLQSNEIYSTTEFANEKPQQPSSFIENEKPKYPTSTILQFLPSIQIGEGHEKFKQNTKERGTPKRLLDSPIQHVPSNPIGSPRPFTRDPSELDYRLGLNNRNQIQTTHAPWIYNVTPAPIFSVSSAQPTPTSTYGALDASGQFAGMSPPVALTTTKAVQQIIVPYTTKNRPRPFEPIRNVIEGSNKNVHSIDLHEQQESKVVISTATEIPIDLKTTTYTPTSKYITKILASNLRDLLRREQSLKNRSNSNGVDIRKLQKNIDDWTEQEYTSLSHRPSTPTIRGRSKHIPAEYLTTTTTPAPLTKILNSQFFNSAALSTSINNLQNSKPPERGSKHFEYPPIEQNLITNFESAVTQATTTSTTTTIPPTTMKVPTQKNFLDKYTTPIYVRPIPTQPPPEVLWQKAKILISPDTKEKLYVVTPQPRYFPQRFITTPSPAPAHISSTNNQKSPRFIVRPTPGNGSTSASFLTTKTTLYSPEPFGLKGLSAYVPAEPVEIIDGNSKVLTTITPSAKPDPTLTLSPGIRTDYVTIHRNHTKPTMSPSPR